MFQSTIVPHYLNWHSNLIQTERDCWISPSITLPLPNPNQPSITQSLYKPSRMCRMCRMKCRVVKFDFQCRRYYHDYCRDSSYSKPNLICFFNPVLHSTAGFGGFDTWSETIQATAAANCPIVVTSYTALDCPLDLVRFQKEAKRPLQIMAEPQLNPYGSKRPDRNFITDDVAPLIFKNYHYCVLK